MSKKRNEIVSEGFESNRPFLVYVVYSAHFDNDLPGLMNNTVWTQKQKKIYSVHVHTICPLQCLVRQIRDTSLSSEETLPAQLLLSVIWRITNHTATTSSSKISSCPTAHCYILDLMRLCNPFYNKTQHLSGICH